MQRIMFQVFLVLCYETIIGSKGGTCQNHACYVHKPFLVISIFQHCGQNARDRLFGAFSVIVLNHVLSYHLKYGYNFLLLVLYLSELCEQIVMIESLPSGKTQTAITILFYKSDRAIFYGVRYFQKITFIDHVECYNVMIMLVFKIQLCVKVPGGFDFEIHLLLFCTVSGFIHI